MNPYRLWGVIKGVVVKNAAVPPRVPYAKRIEKYRSNPIGNERRSILAKENPYLFPKLRS